jgi:poly(3-hydroxybutyrate) depolymerase
MPRLQALRLSPLLAIVFVTVSAAASAKSGPVRNETLESGGRARTCWVYRPSSVGAECPTPLLLLLHGSGGDGASLVRDWQKLADHEGILLAGPDALNRQAWKVPEDGPRFLADVVGFLRSRYAIDEKRIYLFGHSAGAVFALVMGPLESVFFAAVAAHAGAFRDRAPLAVLSHVTRPIPVLFVVGTRDPFFSVEAVRETKDAFAARGLPTELLEIPGHGHSYHEVAREINRKIWDFLSTKQLDREARFTSYGIP